MTVLTEAVTSTAGQLRDDAAILDSVAGTEAAAPRDCARNPRTDVPHAAVHTYRWQDPAAERSPGD